MGNDLGSQITTAKLSNGGTAVYNATPDEEAELVKFGGMKRTIKKADGTTVTAIVMGKVGVAETVENVKRGSGRPRVDLLDRDSVDQYKSQLSGPAGDYLERYALMSRWNKTGKPVPNPSGMQQVEMNHATMNDREFRQWLEEVSKS